MENLGNYDWVSLGVYASILKSKQPKLSRIKLKTKASQHWRTAKSFFNACETKNENACAYGLPGRDGERVRE
jgi:hypothetical protein